MNLISTWRREFSLNSAAIYHHQKDASMVHSDKPAISAIKRALLVPLGCEVWMVYTLIGILRQFLAAVSHFAQPDSSLVPKSCSTTLPLPARHLLCDTRMLCSV